VSSGTTLEEAPDFELREEKEKKKREGKKDGSGEDHSTPQIRQKYLIFTDKMASRLPLTSSVNNSFLSKNTSFKIHITLYFQC
jgi:ribosome assembly protein YihI (activator of Der GTPase)